MSLMQDPSYQHTQYGSLNKGVRWKEGVDRSVGISYVITYAKNRSIIMTSITATQARRQLYTLLDDVANSHEPIQIAGKRHSAVLVAEDDWRAIQETLYLTSIPGMRDSIVKGLKTPVEKCKQELDW